MLVSEVFYNGFFFLFIIYIITMLISGIFFMKRGYQIKMNNLYILSIAYLSFPIGLVGNFLFNLSIVFLEIFVAISFISVILFTNETFYQEQRLMGKIVLIIEIILSIFNMITEILLAQNRTPFLYTMKLIVDTPYSLLAFNWLAWSSYYAYKNLKFKDNIQPWIKARYKMVFVFSFIMGLHEIPEIFQPWNIKYADPGNIISLTVFGIISIIIFISGVGILFAWLMPDFLKRYFNRNYEFEEEKELSEEELTIMIKNQLSEKKG